MKKIISAAVFVAVLSVVYYFLIVKHAITFSQIGSFIKSMGIWAPLALIIIDTLVLIFFMPGMPLTLLAGALFGVFWGAIYISLAAFLAAVISFAISRGVAGVYVDQLIHKKFKKLSFCETELEEKGFFWVFIIRFIPVIPYGLSNYVLGLTKVSKKDYITATALAVIPVSFAWCYLGSSLAGLKFINLIFASCAVGLLAVLGRVLGSRYHKKLIMQEVDEHKL